MAGPRVTDQTFASLKQHLSDREVVELLMTIGEYWMLARVMTVLGVDVEPPAGLR